MLVDRNLPLTIVKRYCMNLQNNSTPLLILIKVVTFVQPQSCNQCRLIWDELNYSLLFRGKYLAPATSISQVYTLVFCFVIMYNVIV